MFQSSIDLVFFSFAAVVMAITAIWPQWAIYVLTYGNAERIERLNSRFGVIRIFAAIGAISIAISLAGAGMGIAAP